MIFRVLFSNIHTQGFYKSSFIKLALKNKKIQICRYSLSCHTNQHIIRLKYIVSSNFDLLTFSSPRQLYSCILRYIFLDWPNWTKAHSERTPQLSMIIPHSRHFYYYTLKFPKNNRDLQTTDITPNYENSLQNNNKWKHIIRGVLPSKPASLHGEIFRRQNISDNKIGHKKPRNFLLASCR